MTAMDNRRLRVFVSSSMSELAEERRTVKRALDELRVDAWVFESDAGARPRSVQDTYLEELASADLYIVLFWRAYGEYTIDEFQHARELEKDCLVYEKRTGIEDRDARLQEFLAGAQDVETGLTVKWFESAEELSSFIKDDVAAWQAELVRRRAPRRAEGPFQAPALRPGYVPRPDVTVAVKTRLLPDDGDTLTLVALHGMAGSGKSVMATAVAGDSEVRDRFSDGVLWATLGTEPDATGLLAGWIRALSDRGSVSAFQPTTQDLETLLRDKAALLVLDDVWEPDDARQLIAGGPACAVLLTTREGRVARECGARPEDIVELGAMTEAQSLALLAGGEERTLPESVREQAMAVARAVGFLPLALRLAAAQAADGVPWEILLDDLTAEIARLESLDDPELAELADSLATKELSLIGSLNLSVSRLPAERRDQFAWLGVLPDEAAVSASMATTLWDTDERSARDVLRYFRSKALLLTAEPAESGAPTYAVHDTLHALARRLLTSPKEPTSTGLPSGLGLSLTEGERRLLDRYRLQRRGAAWHTVPDDGYIHDRLTWHLERAGLAEEVHALLREETPDGRNAWFSVRESHGQFHGYAADLRRALEVAQNDAGSVAREVRYVLMLGSLSSLAVNVPPALAGAALAAGVWNLPQALGYVEQTPDPAQRARSLAAIAGCVPDPRRRALLVQAFEIGQTLGNGDDALGSLVSPLAAAGLTEEALELARRVGWGDPRTSALASVASHMKPDERENIVREALDVANETQEVFRGAALEPVLPFLGEDAVQRLLEESHTMENRIARSWVVSNLAQRLGELGRVDEALEAASGIDDEIERALSITRLASKLDEPRRSEVLREVLAAARRIDMKQWQETLEAAFADLGGILAPALVLGTLRQYALWPADLLRALPGDLPEALLREALVLAEGWGGPALIAAVGDSPRELAERGRAQLEGIRVMEDERTRAEALGTAAEHLDEAGLEEAVAVAEGMQKPETRAAALEGLAPYLPPPLLLRALELASAIDDGDAQLLATCALASGLGQPELEELLERAAAYEHEYVRARALALLAPHLPNGLLERAGEVARAISWGTAAGEVALPALARRSPEPAKTALLRTAIDAAAAMDDSERIAWALEAFADQLSPEMLDEALTKLTGAAPRFAPKFRDFGLARILAAAVPHLGGERRSEVVEHALALAGRVDDRKWQAQLLSLLAPALSVRQFGDALSLIAEMPDPFERARAYAWIVDDAPPHLRGDVVDKAYAELPRFEADELLSVDDKAEIVLTWILPHTVSTATTLATAVERASEDAVLGELSQGEAEPLAGSLVTKVLDMIEGFRDEGRKRAALAGVREALPPDLHERALDIARSISHAGDRATALVALAPHVADESERLLEEALHAALSVETDLLLDTTIRPVLSQVAGRALELPAESARRLWVGALPTLASVTRPDLLAKLHSLGPFICKLDEAAPPEAYRALTDVARGWP
jgi:hypothetical protein